MQASLSPPPARGRSANARASGRSREGVQGDSRFDRTPKKTERAQRLRRESTEAEKRLWARLRNNQIGGAAFRRQHPAGPYVLDFFCPRLGLAVEIDGGQHNETRQRHRDRSRDAWMSRHGVVTLRFWNSDVIENLPGVLDRIHAAVQKLSAAGVTPTRRWRADLPLSGGGEEIRRGDE